MYNDCQKMPHNTCETKHGQSGLIITQIMKKIKVAALTQRLWSICMLCLDYELK